MKNKILNKNSCRLFPLVLIFLAFQNSLAAVDTLKPFIGTWQGEGKVMGLESKITMTWEEIWGGKFTKLIFRNEMKTKNGESQLFEGNAYYKNIDLNKYQGNWFDSGGESHPINATYIDNSLDSLWGTNETKLGRTIYRLIEKDKMEIIDSIKTKDGTWREFGRSVLTKMKQ